MKELFKRKTFFLYYKNELKKAFAKIHGPVFMEGRSIILDDATLFGYQLQQKELLEKFMDRMGTLIVCVYYTEDGNSIWESKTEIKGRIVSSKGSSESLSDCMWKADDYSFKTLAELGEHLCIQNEPYLNLADHLRTHVFNGIMEIHIFVSPINPTLDFQEKFKANCVAQGMKACNLRLDFVKHGFLGVLMSSRYVTGKMDFIWRECFKDARILSNAGFDVIRSKIEATASIEGVPQSIDDALQLPSHTYFEFHMVFSSRDGTTATEQDIQEVKEIAVKLEKKWGVCVPLSTNAMGTQRFLNMRTYGIGKSDAYPRLQELQQEVENAGFKVPRFIREFGVYDSDVRIDAGWLEPPEKIDYVSGFIPRW